MMPLSSARESGDVAILLVLCQCPPVAVHIYSVGETLLVGVYA